ncbi:hypothetical protein BC834DRAFT_875839 [Gloeopeniophorella convolvens]|nr:hypothetical protein BC834DRAFT_875839 [Gloeopeniophorella convolvens]
MPICQFLVMSFLVTATMPAQTDTQPAGVTQAVCHAVGRLAEARFDTKAYTWRLTTITRGTYRAYYGRVKA